MERIKIKPVKGHTLNESDRLTIATLLIKAGYTVREGKEKLDNKSTYTHYIEFWE